MMVYAMRRFGWSAGGWCASTRFATSIERCRSLRREDVFGGARQHARAVGMFGKAGAELHAGIDGELVRLGLLRAPAGLLRTWRTSRARHKPAAAERGLRG